MESGGAQAAASAAATRSRITLGDDGFPVEEKRRRTESGSALAVVPPMARRSRSIAYGADGRPVDGVSRATLLPNCKHGDGSINTVDYWTKVYRLKDTRERVPCLEPMMMSEPSSSCCPNWRACETHEYVAMMQIFSLKLPYTYVDGPVQLYGYMAVRDLLNPFRNYVFKRSRDDPFIVEREDGFIQMSGPKRGIGFQAIVLIEFDMKIKRGGEEADDLQLIDGVAYFDNVCTLDASVLKRRIDGDCGAVDMTLALLQLSVEATIQVRISDREHSSGLSLTFLGTYIRSTLVLPESIRLFDGVIAPETHELERSVVAVPLDGQLALVLKFKQMTGDGSDPLFSMQYCFCTHRKHGHQIFTLELGFATVEVKVTWSTLDFPRSLLGPDCYEYECDAVDDVGDRRA